MNIQDILSLFRRDKRVQQIVNTLEDAGVKRVRLSGIAGSANAFIILAAARKLSSSQVVIMPDRESAAYLFNDLENILGEQSLQTSEKKVLFYPSSYKRVFDFEHQDPQHILMRTEVLNRLGSEAGKKSFVVTYPAAISELITDRSYIREHTLVLKKSEMLSPDKLADRLLEMRFDRVDFVYEPGQFSVRGGIVDVYSFSEEYPVRADFFGDEISSLRFFDPASQISVSEKEKVTILPNVQDRMLKNLKRSFVKVLPSRSVLWMDDLNSVFEAVDMQIDSARKTLSGDGNAPAPEDLLTTLESFKTDIQKFRSVITGPVAGLNLSFDETVDFGISPQPVFNKNFELLSEKLKDNVAEGMASVLFSENEKQQNRLNNVFADLLGEELENYYSITPVTIHEGFEDQANAIACYTDHQIFDRYHRYRIRDGFKTRESLNIKELTGLTPGDFITHIEYGIGKFDGLEKINNNGKEQEAIRIIYGNNDLLYVNIHSLHRIAKYVGKEGTEPKLHRLGSNAWKNLKSKTKGRVKDIAKELIKLYAERKSSEGFRFSSDTYLQHELEASFFYEDTPDQFSATADIKSDMEKAYPMDRLVCGDVGFGKTEVAIRAAFKAVNDSKQVAILVPTTILALQHYRTFTGRLNDFPCNIEYINRFRTTKQIKDILKRVENGDVDILIGTHRIVSKDVKFKDLGLLVVDEEQKFGVSVKEKLKQFKVNVDTLTLTATPIPRTLQFSMLGARDLSVINTPPPNRYPVHTEVTAFSSDVIREAISYELARGGQVFFVHNRVQNIMDVSDMIRKFVPGVRVAVGHGKMDGKILEKVMLDFIEGKYDVLLSTTIVESGLDIPNANTMIINNAQNFGLSDLHQLRGRVGRTNKKAFCYLLAPPLSSLTQDARKRLRAIEEFSTLGSGFNIAMRDLDIRGAGDLLGAEQSGFISDIGYDMFQKILDEAIIELKQNDPAFIASREEGKSDWVTECVLETDMELLIPDSYVSNITERLSLYRELENSDNDEKLAMFRMHLKDRFGTIPAQTLELTETVRLRRMGKAIGFEKIVMKKNRLSCAFINNPESPYFQSVQFGKILQYAQMNQRECAFKERNKKLSLVFVEVNSVRAAIEKLTPIYDLITS